MIFGYITLFTALIISLSAAIYSILGLTAIFAAAFWPIVIMGGSLEVGKIITTLWLHKYWDRAEIQYKLYLCSAVVVLMFLTSMGVFGFLSKAHSDQSLVSGDSSAKVAIYDEKIKTERDNVEVNRKALKQMDEAVDQVMARSTSEGGADKAVAIRRSQQKERQRLQAEISDSQKKISSLSEEKAPLAAENRKVEAEVGPIKYIAAMVYGDNPDANVLEKAVRWVIILIVSVFDPLALTLLLAATKAIEWEHGIDLFAPKKKEEDEGVDQDDDELTDEQLAQINRTLQDQIPEGDYGSSVTDAVLKEIPHGTVSNINQDPSTPGWMFPTTVKPVKEVAEVINEPDPLAHIIVPEIDRNEDPLHHMAKVMWRAANPDVDEREHHALHQAGEIDRLPWHTADHINSLAISDGERKQLIERFANAPPPAKPTPSESKTKFVEIDALKLIPDNLNGPIGEVKGFGTQFPTAPTKGDMFLRVDQLPSVLYKFNGMRWIEVDKTLTDSHAYDTAYIDHLISKIDSGEYDPELLSDAERDSIERRLKNTTRGT